MLEDKEFWRHDELILSTIVIIINMIDLFFVSSRLMKLRNFKKRMSLQAKEYIFTQAKNQKPNCKRSLNHLIKVVQEAYNTSKNAHVSNSCGIATVQSHADCSTEP